jgi:hypothetical protein
MTTSTPATRFFINIDFDDKDAVKAQFQIRWDNTRRSWYADDAEIAVAAQALAREASGVRHFAVQEAAAAERKAAAAAAAAKAAKVAAALEGSSLTLAQVVEAEVILRRRAKQKFLHADDEHAFRAIFSDLARGLKLESSTRNRNFDASAALAALAAAKQVLAA